MSALVRYALATHLHVAPGAVRDSQRLAADLELTPLDLVWIAMRVEALSVSGDFPVESLREIETVGDLVAVFQRWAETREQEVLDLSAE